MRGPAGVLLVSVCCCRSCCARRGPLTAGATPASVLGRTMARVNFITQPHCPDDHNTPCADYPARAAAGQPGRPAPRRRSLAFSPGKAHKLPADTNMTPRIPGQRAGTANDVDAGWDNIDRDAAGDG